MLFQQIGFGNCLDHNLERAEKRIQRFEASELLALTMASTERHLPSLSPSPLARLEIVSLFAIFLLFFVRLVRFLPPSSLLPSSLIFRPVRRPTTCVFV